MTEDFCCNCRSCLLLLSPFAVVVAVAVAVAAFVAVVVDV